MATPNWESAPSWARWFSVDYDWRGRWHRIKPRMVATRWMPESNSEMTTEFDRETNMLVCVNWRKSLEKRQ